MQDPAQTQDLLGQLPLLKAYNHLLLGFATPDGVSQSAIVSSLEAAALKLTTHIPWLGGKVVNVGAGDGTSGAFQVVPCDKFAPPNSILIVKDCTDLCPPWEELMKAKAPISILDGKTLCPRDAFPISYPDSEEDPAPALLIQLNLIKGGVLLNLAGQHNLSDGGGLIQIFNLLATTLRGEEYPPTAVENATQDRRNLIRLLGPGEPPLDHSHLVRPPPGSLRLSLPNSPFVWQYFRFSAVKLAELKNRASNAADFDPAVRFISTNDATCAFLWQRILSVRLRRRQTPDDLCKFSRAVDVRRMMGISPEYMGVTVSNASCYLTFREVTTSSLSFLASTLRQPLSQVNEYAVRSFATFLSQTEDKTPIAYAGKFNPDTDMGISSIAGAPLYHMDFGPLLGKVELVRRPNFSPIMSTIYLMPETRNKDVDMLVCLPEVDIQALRDDPEWTAYVEYIG
ncbi:trichothecene biosynthesis acetyltransferase [Aspergillus cavernicola]|uniref:Trichothecene biosynthesis acetyltransferase n=1 Tax=Aspergillus cavernicola TaxID=176166 RepID=A0ABR4HF45_9EURO